MPRLQKGKTSGRAVGKTQKRSSTEPTWDQQLWLSALVVYCMSRQTAVFVGTPTTTGSIRLNLYPPDDRCQGSLSLMDDWSVEVPAMLSDVFEEDITADDLYRVVGWLAERAAEAPRSVKPTLHTREPVLVPGKPAQ